MLRRIEPGSVELDPGGVPYSAAYGDVYASRAGALAQARHVFLRGSELPQRWQGRDQFVIVETGFGLGVNFLAAWQAWRDDPLRPRRLHFVSIELQPVDAATLARFAPDELAPLAQQLADRWPPRLPGLHRRTFENDAIVLTLGFGDANELLPQLVLGADAFFLDGFAPDRNPGLWSPRVLGSLGRLAREDATVATWSTARVVRDGLAAAGFELQIAAGFGHKRAMLCARFAPRWRVRRHDVATAFEGERGALVIGAGIAGAHAARALVRRGWRVQVLERASSVTGASAPPWGLLHPQVTSDDNDAARLTRAGFLLACEQLSRFAAAAKTLGDPAWRELGAFVQARDTVEAARWRAAALSLGLPENFARFHAPDEIAASLGAAPRQGGWWFPHAARIAAAPLCAALLDDSRVTLRTGSSVARLRLRDDCWFAEGADGTTLAAAPVCVVAGAHDAPRLLNLKYAGVQAVRGQISLFAVPAALSLRAALGGGGTLVPVEPGVVAVGATYDFDAADDPLDLARAHAANRQRLARLLGEPVAATPIGCFDALRCVARDRLPLVGAVADETAALRSAPAGAHLADLPRQRGLYASFAFGSRGLALAPLAAELIAAQVEGEPWPIERRLAARIDVGRFLLHAVRRGAR
jgi:tRNA 5-methylaminomethyl-2-thiouridine biosynthesis bifunctional protein